MLAAGCVAAAGCVFDSAGLGPQTRGDGADRSSAELTIEIDASIDQTADVPWDRAPAPGEDPVRFDARRDGSAPKDSKPPPDSKPPDTKPAKDTKPWPDSGTYKPVGTTELLAAWNGTQVKCIADNGTWNNTYIKILDSTTWAVIVDGSITLAAATQETKTWVGGKPSVTVIFDPQSCGQEDPINYDGEWGSAGILVRGATLSAGKLVLSAGVTTADMDFLDVTNTGGFESGSDFAKADDSGMPGYPQLAVVVTAIKQGILQAATP